MRKIAVTVLIAAAALSLREYFVRDDVGGDVLWNTNEAYFFIGINTRGLRVSWLGYPWFLFKTYLGGFAGVELPDDDRGSLVVVHVAASGVEHHVLERKDPEISPALYTPRGGHIYADCPLLGGLCMWAGDRFEPATLDGKRGFDAIPILSANDFENQNGWSKRGFGSDSSFTVDMGDKFELLVNGREPRDGGRGAISIDRQFPGRASSRIFNLDVRNEKASRSEYRRIFDGRQPIVVR